jgi:hypothetical protein
MVQESSDNQSNVAPEEVWGQMSDEQRARALDLLTEIALKYVLTQIGKGKGAVKAGTCEPAEDTPT